MLFRLRTKILKMSVLPPGTLLQLMYLRERICHLQPGRFIEVGPGHGEITKLLLDLGWVGCSYDIEVETVELLRNRFAKEIADLRYMPINEDYLSIPPALVKVDLVISCMVMEHLDEEQQNAFMQHSKTHLIKEGRMIGLVPASPRHWGIEDEVAGHFRRYTRDTLTAALSSNGWRLEHIAGLTYPISNLFLPISNYLVSRQESQKLSLSKIERTKLSGKRKVNFKTHFKLPMFVLLNKVMFWPLGIIQKCFAKSENCLVLYFEAKFDIKECDK